jgi:TonB family protein
MLLEIAAASVILAQATPHSPATSGDRVPAPDCRRLLTNPAPGTNELCLAQDALQAAEGAADGSGARQQKLTAAAEQFSRATNLLRDPRLRLYAFEALTRIYDPSGLNEPARVEQTLREMAGLMPGDSSPLRRLAKVQEDAGNADAAENTLLAARQQLPEDAEVYSELSAFYARRAAALKAEAKSRLPLGGEQPDAEGYYRVGNMLGPPEMLDSAEPSPGMVADLQSNPPAVDDPDIVVLEVKIDETGAVADATVIKSVPGQDAAVMSAAKQWRFKPTLVDGRPVPMKMTAVVRVRRQ